VSLLNAFIDYEWVSPPYNPRKARTKNLNKKNKSTKGEKASLSGCLAKFWE